MNEMKYWLIARTLLAAESKKFDGHDVAFGVGAVMVALGLAWFSVPLALIGIGGCMVIFAVHGARS